jgi:DNA processing protein
VSINSVAFGQKGYPEQLRHIPDAPKLLYFSGPLAELCKEPCVAIVGSRKVTPYGRAVTEKLAGELARQGVVIVSGLALGVDSIAHEAALRAHGRTIAVLPRDIEHIYPVSHTGLAQRILSAGGALISEYPEGSDLHKFQFLERNRIIAGLSRGVIIPEAAARSGSLNTANAALEQGREVMAVPVCYQPGPTTCFGWVPRRSPVSTTFCKRSSLLSYQ